jgi:hypothetical protein
LNPPASDQARTCIVTCEGNENTCIGNAQNASGTTHCEAGSIQVFDTCIAGLQAAEYANARQMWGQSQADRRFEDCTGNVNSRFENAVAQCRLRHRACYSTCGGTVSTETVCVRNCENQPPKALQPATTACRGRDPNSRKMKVMTRLTLKTLLSLAAFHLILTGCVSSSVQQMSRTSFQISSKTAPICGDSPAPKIASQVAAIEVLRRGGNFFILTGADTDDSPSGNFSGKRQGVIVKMIDVTHPDYADALSARDLFGR